MKDIRITVMRKACYRDLMAKYENPLEHPMQRRFPSGKFPD